MSPYFQAGMGIFCQFKVRAWRSTFEFLEKAALLG